MRNVSRRSFLKATAGSAVLGLSQTSARAQEPDSRPPNIVLVMTDDQGQWALGCYGNREIVTPNIDRLAATGVRLPNSYATIPVCSPSRATFMTGLIPSQHGIHDWIHEENEGVRARGLIDRFVSVTDILAQRGYTCGLSGKWHLGDNPNPFRNHPYWFALPTGGSVYNNARVSMNGRLYQSEGYLTDRITDHALEFIDQNRDRPFFVNVQYNAPHGPWKGHPQRILDMYKDCPFDSIPKEPRHPWASALIEHLGKRETLMQYYASITAVDEGVGRIVQRLDELGLRENTIVLFMSDQGFQCGHNGLFGKGNCSNPRNMYEESMLIPTVANCPGRIPSGQASERLVNAYVSGYDLMPTLLELADCTMPEGRYAGKSYAPLLLGNTMPWENTVYGEYGRARMIRTETWKLIHRADGGPNELFHIAEDPREDVNLAQEPGAKEDLLRLRKQLSQWFAQYCEGDADPVGYEYLRPNMR